MVLGNMEREDKVRLLLSTQIVQSAFDLTYKSKAKGSLNLHKNDTL